MITLEQVKLLETKVVRAIEYVERISKENFQLQGKLDSYQKRIDELEVLIQKFREDQGRIEDGILSALDRLNKFEDAIEKSIAPPPPPSGVPPQRENQERKKETPPPAAGPRETDRVSELDGWDGETIEKLAPEGAEDVEDAEEVSAQDDPAPGEFCLY
jgi:hypothetical protein